MKQLEELERFRDAYELVKEGLRVSIVCALTGVTSHFVKGMWQDVHDELSKRGQLPTSVHVFVKDPSIAAHLSGFVAYCKTKHSDLRSVIAARPLLEAVREYRWLSGTDIDITAAYYAVRDVAANIVDWRYCRCCDAHHLYSIRRFAMRGCPFCRLAVTKKAA
jgi:hypothetical protein